MKKIYTVILAAGFSSRLGFNKLILKIDGKTVIRKAVEPFIASGCRKIFIITGFEENKIRHALHGFSVEYINNQHYSEGMSSSIKAALPFIKDGEGVFFHLGDKPLIEKGVVMQMKSAFERSNKAILVPVYNGMKGHPVLMNIVPYIKEIETLTGEKGLREIIERHPEDTLHVQGTEGNILDIDTVEDVELLRKRGYHIEEG
jgi:molybdenum cofactor cytidylyltransferase